MTPAEILHTFATAETHPEAVLRDAFARRDELLPVFLAEIERWLAAEDDEPSPLFYVFHLLGAWRAKEAYPLLARVLRADSERLEQELGDATTATSSGVIVAVFEGDFGPISEIIEDPGADEFVRMAMFEALVGLVAEGKLSRDEAAAFLRGCPGRLDAAPVESLWAGWANAIVALKLRELREVLVGAVANGTVDAEVIERDELLRDLNDPAYVPQPWRPFGEDIVEELAATYTFDGDGEEEETVQPFVNPHRHIGRNDPCPCGSGQKYKRCCGR